MALRYSKLFEATDSRDYVYRVLGMTNTTLLTDEGYLGQQPRKGVLVVDYRTSVSQVFQDVVKYFLNRDRDLTEILVAPLSHRDDLSLPSWTPDWRFYSPDALVCL